MSMVAEAANKREVGWSLVGRFQNLPLTGLSGRLVIEQNSFRLGMRFYNAGFGDVQIARTAGPIIAGNGLPIPSLGVMSDELISTSAYYAVGDAGHDLYVAEKLA
jgi:hypothetical protein